MVCVLCHHRRLIINGVESLERGKWSHFLLETKTMPGGGWLVRKECEWEGMVCKYWILLYRNAKWNGSRRSTSFIQTRPHISPRNCRKGDTTQFSWLNLTPPLHALILLIRYALCDSSSLRQFRKVTQTSHFSEQIDFVSSYQ